MSWTWITVAVSMLLVIFLIQSFLLIMKTDAKTKSLLLPPGPRGFPIFGSLHLLGKNPHKDLHKLAQKYGPIMFMRLGLMPTVVVSTPQAAELFLRTHDLVFASRPPLQAFKHTLYNQKDLIMAPYGSYWRTVRKMSTLVLFSNYKITSFKSMRKEELDLLIGFVRDNQTATVDLSAKVGSLNADMTCRMVFGKKYMDEEFDERGFKGVIQEDMGYAATPNLGDYIPQLASLDLQGLTRKLKAISKVFDRFLVKVIGEHVQSSSSRDENRNKDFVDLLLSFMGSEETDFQIDIEHVKAIILDMLIAGIDTSAAAIEWTLSELMKHPRVSKKVQKELENVVGKDRMVEESDLDNLEYLDMVIKESLRLHPVAPLLLPHESMEDCIVNGFHIPKKSRIFINAWAIGRDPNAWNDPDKFFPERFVDGDIDLHGRDFQLIPFGSGRRSCPGMQLGLTVVRLVLAQLMHCFDWELPDGTLPNELDMTEHFGIVTCRAKHLLAIPTYRLNKS
ncbi:hypothetical protein EZV62_015179 [Acer yangbiense]|uniref:Cytochrome P450 n=1 Tax=Acer yangbiense TaxID=1000413 RepID=A0A5C7HWA4_9ROSI|nr:hypothetical protein EZV62_015179 [Acer yangbiense]